MAPLVIMFICRYRLSLGYRHHVHYRSRGHQNCCNGFRYDHSRSRLYRRYPLPARNHIDYENHHDC